MVVSTEFNSSIANHEQYALCRMPGCNFHAESVHTGPRPPPIGFPLMSKSLSLWDKMGYNSHSTQRVEEDGSASSTGTYPFKRRRRKLTLDGRAGSYKDWFSSGLFPGLFDVCKRKLLHITIRQKCLRTPIVGTWSHKTKQENDKSLQPIRSSQEQSYFSITLVRCWETVVTRKCQSSKHPKISFKSSSTSPQGNDSGMPTIPKIRTSTECRQGNSHVRRPQTSKKCR